jgi:hypothetical protein
MASDMAWSYVIGEWQELLAEIRSANFAGIREEWSDVSCCAGLYLAAVGIVPGWMPILPGLGLYAARKFIARRVTWARIFAHHGLEFDRRYLTGGGNFAKMRKVKAALGLAGFTGRIDAEWLRAEGIVTEE